jgi:peptide/nickel transport system permease protein
VVFAALLAPWIAPHPDAVDLVNNYAGWGPDHWLGTDALGRDVFARAIWGGRVSLLAPALVTILTSSVGTFLCLVAVWRRGATDAIFARVLDVVFAFPFILLAVLAAAAMGKGLLTSVLALSLAFLPFFARVVRGAALVERSRPYVESLSSAGIGPWRVCSRHLLPNLAPLILTQMALTFSSAVGAFGAMSYLGLGTQPPKSDWGVMIASGQQDMLGGHPQQTLAAIVLLVGVVVCVNIIAERIISRYQGACE